MADEEPFKGRRLRVASLFSGAGGLDLGLQEAGHDIVLQVEIDTAAREVLCARFPGVRLARDVRELDCLPPDVDLVTASFPCIDVSRAGCRQGINGRDTGLVKHVFRLLEGRRVQWVLLENVPGLLDRFGTEPPAISIVVKELERLGYRWAHRIVDSRAFGIPHRRRRVFILASLDGDPRDVLLSQISACVGICTSTMGSPCARCADSARDDEGLKPAYVADLSNAVSAPSLDYAPTFTTNNHRMCILREGQLGMLRTEDAERLQGFPRGWTEPAAPQTNARAEARAEAQADKAAAAAERMHAAGGSRAGAQLPAAAPRASSKAEARNATFSLSHLTAGASVFCSGPLGRREMAARWELLGNAVTVPVARWIGDRLAQPYKYKYFHRGDVHKWADAAPEAWPAAAWNMGDGRHSAEAGVGEFPVFVPFTRLGDFVRELGPPPPKEAVTVYLQRMEEKGWHIASEMRVVLEAAAQGVFETSRGGGGGGSGGGKHPREPKEKDADELSVFFEDPGQRRLVWAKYATHPWWPALVVDLEADYVPPRTLQSRRSEDHVLVVFFGDGAWQWVSDSKFVRDFEEAFDELSAASPGRSRALFAFAVQEAKEELERRKSQGARSKRRKVAPPVLQGPKFRCNVCKLCKAKGTACLMLLAWAEAGNGHQGARVAVLGDRAIGERVEVLWPMDGQSYRGAVISYDSHLCTHRVLYDDGDIEVLTLWKETVIPLGKLPEGEPQPGLAAAARRADAAAAAAAGAAGGGNRGAAGASAAGAATPKPRGAQRLIPPGWTSPPPAPASPLGPVVASATAGGRHGRGRARTGASAPLVASAATAAAQPQAPFVPEAGAAAMEAGPSLLAVHPQGAEGVDAAEGFLRNGAGDPLMAEQLLGRMVPAVNLAAEAALFAAPSAAASELGKRPRKMPRRLADGADLSAATWSAVDTGGAAGGGRRCATDANRGGIVAVNLTATVVAAAAAAPLRPTLTAEDPDSSNNDTKDDDKPVDENGTGLLARGEAAEAGSAGHC